MAKQITQLPVAASVAASDVFPLDQSGTTKQATLTAIAAGLPANGTGGLVRQLGPTFGEIRVSNINGVSDAGAYSIIAGVGLSATGGGFMQFYGGTHPSHPGRVFFGSGTLTHSAFDSAGNLGLGTFSPAARAHVSGVLRVDGAGAKIEFTDTFGTNPAFVQQGDNNFVFYGTNSTGGQRAIFTSIMRSDTEPLNVAVPLRIGNGSSISTVLTAVANLTLGTISANGGVQTIDITVTGATSDSTVTINCISTLSNSSIIFKADCVSANTVRIYFVNPTASPVTLSNADYRITVIKFA